MYLLFFFFSDHPPQVSRDDSTTVTDESHSSRDGYTEAKIVRHPFCNVSRTDIDILASHFNGAVMLSTAGRHDSLPSVQAQNLSF
jgi:hypothetical protein